MAVHAINDDGAIGPLGFPRDTYVQDFLPSFLADLYGHLKSRGWTSLYAQHLVDESHAENYEAYARVAALVRKHLPGIPTIDAMNRIFDRYSTQLGIGVWWYGYIYLPQWRGLMEQRVTQGKTNWIYTACSPGPPCPNTHLDMPLCMTRIFGWLAHYYKAEGFLHWGANMYRGADPYKTSIGPLPNGSQAPGHPPGDNWWYYPTDDGLVPSLRCVALREGIEDYALLRMLEGRDRTQAKAILSQIVRELYLDYPNRDLRVNCARDSLAFHRARRELLLALDAVVSKE